MLNNHMSLFSYYKNVFKSKVFRVFLFSYLMILVIPLLAGTFSYIKTAKTMEQEALKYSQALLSQASQSMDMQLVSIDQTVKDISTNKKIRDFIIYTRSTGYALPYDILEISNELQRYTNTNPFIGRMFIYSRHLDSVITKNAKYSSQLYYNQITPYTEISYNEWKSLLDRYNDMSFLAVQDIAEAGGKRGVLSIFNTLNFDTSAMDDSYMSLGIIIDADIIRRGFENIQYVNQGAFYLLDQSGDILMSAGNPQMSIPLEMLKQVTVAGEIQTHNIDNNKQETVITAINAKKYGWKYVLVMPTDIFMKKVNYIKVLTIGTFLFSLLLGLLAAFLLSFKNTSPVLKLISSLGGRGRAQLGNEYNVIENLVDNIIFKNKRYKELLDNQESVLKYRYTAKAEEQFTNVILSGNEEEVIKLIDFLLEQENTEDTKVKEIIYCLYFNLLYTYMKISNMVGFENPSYPRIDFDKYMDGNVTPIEMDSIIKDLYTNLCRYIRDGRSRQHNNRLIDDIQQYIGANYSDPDLSLTKIADAVSLSPGYISRIYKNITGINITDYINKIRISNAKRLLENQGTLLQDIALSVGYINNEALIKAFKRHEGIPPGKYRECLKESMINGQL